MDKNALIGAALGAAVVLVVNVLWDTFGKGVESTVASNPAITAMEARLDAHMEEFDNLNSDLRSFASEARATDAAIIRNQDRILDALTGN